MFEGEVGFVLNLGDLNFLLIHLVLELGDPFLQDADLLLQLRLLGLKPQLLVFLVLKLQVLLQCLTELDLELWDLLETLFVHLKRGLGLQ